MPADFIIKTGDMIQITIPPPTIVPILLAPIPLIGTSTNTQVVGMPACLQGDEIPPPLLVPVPYTSPPFVTPGLGKVTIILSPGVHLTTSTSDQKPLIIKGASPFQVLFNVQTPAMQPTPAGPVPDPLAVKSGTGQFITTNMIVKAS